MRLFRDRSKVPLQYQLNSNECGIACLTMVSRYYGRNIPYVSLVSKVKGLHKQGITTLTLARIATELGFEAKRVGLSYEQFLENRLFPIIVHVKGDHFVVVYKVADNRIYFADPAVGYVSKTLQVFGQMWGLNGIERKNGNTGFVLALIPSVNPSSEIENLKYRNLLQKKELFNLIKPFAWYCVLLFVSLLIGSIIQYFYPFFNKLLIDVGASNKNRQLVLDILLAMGILYMALIAVEFVRERIIIHVSTRISIGILHNFIAKLLRLPLSYFNSRISGDVLQRIYDHERIERFITNNLLRGLFSVLNILVFSIILLNYSLLIFLTFFVLTICEAIIIISFQPKKLSIERQTFQAQAENQHRLLEIINGIQDIKLNTIESKMRISWLEVKRKLFDLMVGSQKLRQWQNGLTRTLFYAQHLLILGISTFMVIDNTISIGAFLSIQFVFSQLLGPVNSVISVFEEGVIARVSYQRLQEIQLIGGEDEFGEFKETDGLAEGDILIDNISFSYQEGYSSVLSDINLCIPAGKTTAIVGLSGSGKTTLLKLLLKFYTPTKGKISVGGIDLSEIGNEYWRSKCGAVLQDSYIFSETVAYNITLSDMIDHDKLVQATILAKIHDFVEELPFGYGTRIGQEGMSISQGQKQRILLARAFYKNPDYLLLDEATNALDTENESIISQNIRQYFKCKTVIVIAHRLSTIKDADQIIVIDNSRIMETGDHHALLQSKGKYFHLVRNQLTTFHHA